MLGFPVFVSVGQDLKEMVKSMKLKDEPAQLVLDSPEILGGGASFSTFTNGISILWFRSWAKDPEHLCRLVHETNHMLYAISRDIGMQDEPEFQAYLQHNLFGNLREIFDNAV